MTTWFTSDTHFSHSNIIKYSNRPFDSVDEMNIALIANWNAKIAQYDTVHFVGDFCFSDVVKGQAIFDQLNGVKHLITGNHDKTAVQIKGWKSINSFAEIRVEGQSITLCHYAMRVWNKSHYGAWMLYGHSHGSLPDDPSALSIDVGVDCHNYQPINMDDISRIMKRKTWKAVDHHA